MKNYITLFCLMCFVNIFSQEIKFEDDLDSLYLKSGDIKLGKIDTKKKHVEICTDKNNCKQFDFKDIDKITYGYPARMLRQNYNENQRRLKRKKEIQKLEYKPLYILNPSGDVIYAEKAHGGNKYDFYIEYKSYFGGPNGDKAKTKNILRITHKGERNPIFWMLLDYSNKKEFKRAKKLIKKYTAAKKCTAIENIVADYKAHERDPKLNLYEALDTCDFSY